MSDKHLAADAETKYVMPGWKKVLLAVSLLVGCVGVGLSLFGGAPAAEETAGAPAAASRSLPGGASSLTAGSPEASGDATPAGEGEGEGGSGLGEWGPPVTRLGFSFFAGFCIAYALRAAFKITAILIGLALLLLFGLQYGGVIDVDWSVIGRHYDSFAAWISAHAGSFKNFITGNLPSAGSAVAGMVLGFRRR